MTTTLDDDRTTGRHHCRLCAAPVTRTFVDLGKSPLCESYLSPSQLDEGEAFYPLHVRTCDECLLVQLDEYVGGGEMFQDYAYFSSYSESWLAHARAYRDTVVPRFGLGADSLVVELASNDGYLLQYFVQEGIPALGIDPAVNVAEAALERGVDTIVDFFDSRLGTELVRDGRTADLITANNVLAQVPPLNDFVEGMRILLAPHGVATIEVPHVVQLIEGLQYDTIYHEHYSYFSLTTLRRLFADHGLEIFDVEELASHGGSLRVYVKHVGDEAHDTMPSVAGLLEREREGGYASPAGYDGFADRVVETRWELLELLIRLRREGRQVAAYGAPGKGNTLLNYCGIRSDLIDYTVDKNPYTQGKYLPGTHIPIYSPERIDETRPDFILLLPWNLKRELTTQLAHVREWGAQLMVPIPRPEVLQWAS
jgi:SAM-dependent methyltransferase